METAPTIPDPFDRGGRYMLRENPPLLGWLLSLSVEAYRFVNWLDARGIMWPGAGERTRDTLAHVLDLAAHGVPWAILVEFQLTPDPDMLSRLMIYLGGARLRLRPTNLPGDRFNVGAVVVNLTGRGKSGQDMHWPKAGLRTFLQIREINLTERDASWTLEEIDVGAAPLPALVFVPLMQRGAEDAIIQRWLTLADREKNPQKRYDLGYVALIMAEAAGCRQVWQEALERWNMQESQVLNEWTKKVVERTEIKSKVESVLDLLADHIGTPPADLVAAIEAIKDPARLKELLLLAGRAESVEQFRKDASL
jgi:hypothetical protein